MSSAIVDMCGVCNHAKFCADTVLRVNMYHSAIFRVDRSSCC